MFPLIELLQIISTQNNLELAPEKSFLSSIKSKFLDMKLVTIQSNPSTQKLQLFTNFFLPQEKLLFIGALNFYTILIDKLHINLKLFHDLFNETTPWNWTDEHERLP